ncbi:MAG: hypothetical protein IPJ03_15940 [Ignavibacteriales bacterium]|nr:hypothetical protein [Ignavibacteriales bacterium]
MSKENSFEAKLRIIRDNFMKRTSWLVIKHIDHKAIWESIEADIRKNFNNVKKTNQKGK